MKYTIALMQNLDGRQEMLRIVGQGVDLIFTGEFVVMDTRPMFKSLTSGMSVAQSIRGEQNEES
jgi:hypothetical protein